MGEGVPLPIRYHWVLKDSITILKPDTCWQLSITLESHIPSAKCVSPLPGSDKDILPIGLLKEFSGPILSKPGNLLEVSHPLWGGMQKKVLDLVMQHEDSMPGASY